MIEAGIQEGDVIESFGGKPIFNFPQLVETVRLYRPGNAVPVKIKRSGSELEVTVVLRRRGDL